MVLYYLIKRENRLIFTILAVFTAIVLNGLFSYINDSIPLPIFMDSLFTIMTAAFFGLWPAVAVGLLTNVFIELINGFPGFYFPFIIINLLTALVTSFFVKKKLFETPTQIFWLIITLSFVTAIIGALIVTIVFGGFTNLYMDNIVRGIILTGQSIFSSVFIVRIVTNIVDKGVAVMCTFIIYKILQKKSSR